MLDERKKTQLLNELAVGKISPETFRSRALEGTAFDIYLVESMLRRSLFDRDPLDVQFWLALIQTSAGSAGAELGPEIFCDLLLEDWHFSHEDLASLLQQIESPESTECLFECASLDLEYLNYDTTYQLARKCIKALAAIGDAAARQRLHELASDPRPPVAEYSTKELKRLRADRTA